jgi:predicted acylesterase/phospholipase RssA
MGGAKAIGGQRLRAEASGPPGRAARSGQRGRACWSRAAVFGLLVLSVACTGCFSARSRNSGHAGNCLSNVLALGLQDQIQLAAARDVRAWADQFSPKFQASLSNAFVQNGPGANGSTVPSTGQVSVLLISGGAAKGAYGAGLLCGLSQAGQRPRYKVVTGISTGALMAPYAFLGSYYDGLLASAYTNTTTKEIYRWSFCQVFGGDSVGNISAFRRRLNRFYGEDLIREVAAEHQLGRRLYVGTTSLDARRPVIWDMGAIATNAFPGEARTNQGAVGLFRDVLLASASMPVVFPPVYFNIQVDSGRITNAAERCRLCQAGRGGSNDPSGRLCFEEMHVDGGVTRHVFLGDEAVNLASLLPQGIQLHVYMIRNGRRTSEPAQVKAFWPHVAFHSLCTMLQAEADEKVGRIQDQANHYGAFFHLASIPDKLNAIRVTDFDPPAMLALFRAGFLEATTGRAWRAPEPGPVKRE